jgi:hypothetical protein
MPKGVPSSVAKEKRDFVLCKIGMAKVRVFKYKDGKKVGDGTEINRPILVWCRENTAEKLNFPLATSADMSQGSGDAKRDFYGTVHGKTVVVQNPTEGAKPKTFSFKVPAWANRTVLTTGFANTKVKAFKFQGGRRQWSGKSSPGAAS